MKLTEEQMFILTADLPISARVMALLDLAGYTDKRHQCDVTGLSINTINHYAVRARKLSEAARRG